MIEETPSPSLPDETRRAKTCPACQNPNGCSMADSDGEDCGINASCWCFSATPAPGALDQIPAAELGKRCLCRSCLTGPRDSKPKDS